MAAAALSPWLIGDGLNRRIHKSTTSLTPSLLFLRYTPINRRNLRSVSSSTSSRLLQVFACSSQPHKPPTKLYVSGLSFRTSEESLRNAFESFGQLIEVNLVMDKIANRPRGFAFLRYATKEESEKAIEGMHGKTFIYEHIKKLRPGDFQIDAPLIQKYTSPNALCK